MESSIALVPSQSPAPRAWWPRLHLFELNDQEWCPRALRNHMTDYLATVCERTGTFDAAAGLIARGLEAAGSDEVLDLASGGGGPLARLRPLIERKLGRPIHVRQSDKFPNARAGERARAAGLEYLEQPVDALKSPPELRGMRTLFSALHQFRPEDARAVLSDAHARGVPIGVFEVMERSLRGVLSMLFVPLMVFAFTPFIRPLTPLRLFFTYLVPLAPLAMTWDGLVSALRAYRPAELRRMTDGLSSQGYTWEVGQLHAFGQLPVTYVLGMPAAKAR